jgi:hypothetical protein
MNSAHFSGATAAKSSTAIPAEAATSVRTGPVVRVLREVLSKLKRQPIL